MQHIILTAPTSWSPYLFYQDKSGLMQGEEHRIDAWLEEHSAGEAFDCKDAGYKNWHDASGYALPAECQTYYLRRAEVEFELI